VAYLVPGHGEGLPEVEPPGAAQLVVHVVEPLTKVDLESRWCQYNISSNYLILINLLVLFILSCLMLVHHGSTTGLGHSVERRVVPEEAVEQVPQQHHVTVTAFIMNMEVRVEHEALSGG
jgi:hypothetical protein